MDRSRTRSLTTIIVAVGVALLMALTTTAAMAIDHLDLTRVELGPDDVVLDAGEGFFVQHGVGVGVCEDGELSDEAAASLDDDRVRFDLFIDGEQMDGEAAVDCRTVETPDGDEVEASTKWHIYIFADGLPAGSYVFRGEWWAFDEDGEDLSIGADEMTVTVQQVDDDEEPADDEDNGVDDTDDDATEDDDDEAEEVERPTRVDTGAGGTAASGPAGLVILLLGALTATGIAVRRRTFTG